MHRKCCRESFLQEPISGYGRNKLACEQSFVAPKERQFQYDCPPSAPTAPGPLIDNLEPMLWRGTVSSADNRALRGDGWTWQSTHRAMRQVFA